MMVGDDLPVSLDALPTGMCMLVCTPMEPRHFPQNLTLEKRKKKKKNQVSDSIWQGCTALANPAALNHREDCIHFL